MVDRLNGQDCANLLFGAGLLRVSSRDDSSRLLVRFLQLESSWHQIGIGQVLLGLKYAGHKELPPGGDKLVAYIVNNVD